ncbi:hypothetical protein BKA69DRAFT_901098 [Paraphysoderma sedebokerense]|nr:hypothetical protein BKA69DRAFT_901098 [Paraphysoderma sedebokerense]
MTVEQAVSTLSRRPRIDRVLTHPAFEAAKMCIRCVPFVASFVYLLDRITQWKLSYASNDADIQQIEKKANDITVTLISMIELLPPEERHQDNPKIKMFKKRIEEIRIIQKYMVEFILEFEQTTDKKKVFFAERNRGIVQMLRQTLSDIERDIQTQLQFHANTSLKVQGLKLNAMGQILYELRRQLSEQGEKNDCLIALISNQIDTTSQALEKLEERLVNVFTPGYVDVRNLEIKDMWWNFFRWPARIPLKQFARCFPDYFERKDADAYTIMSLFRARNLWGLKDLGVQKFLPVRVARYHHCSDTCLCS